MGVMKAIYTDVEELLTGMALRAREPNPSDWAAELREQGWISPTEANIAADMIEAENEASMDYMPDLYRAVRILRGVE